MHPSELAMVEDLCDDHEVLLRSLLGSLAGNASLHFDFGTTDFLTRGHAGGRKIAWMLRSVLGNQANLKKWLEEQEVIQRESGIETPVAAGADASEAKSVT